MNQIGKLICIHREGSDSFAVVNRGLFKWNMSYCAMNNEYIKGEYDENINEKSALWIHNLKQKE